MHELLHAIGLCGEPHPSLTVLLNEHPVLVQVYHYFKTLIR
jgi:hypothetical protein